MSVPGNLYTPTIRKTRGGGYVIEGSGLFDGSTGFLSKTYGAAATNAQTGALEFVLDKTTLVNNATTGAMTLFAAGSSTGGSSMVVIYDSGGWFGSSNDSLVIGDRGGAWYYIFDNILFRDVAAFGQVTIEYDTTLVSGSDRFIVKYNGTRLTASSEVAVTQNTSMDISTNAKSVFIGRQGLDATRFMPMYLARATNIDGSIPADGSFGEFTTDGYWQINDVSGMTFGTNGWLLEGGDNVAAGTDSSGNGNDFTKTGTITATNNSPTDDAANDVGNYATLNPNDKSSNLNLSEGNLTYEYDTRPASEIVKATIYFLYTGKFYWEQENLQTSGQPGRIWGGIHNRDTSLNVSSTNTGVISYTYDGQIKDEASSLGTAASWYTGERSAYAVDCATGEIWIGKVTSGGSTTWYDNTATGGADPAAGTSATASVTNITDWAPCGGWTEGGYSVQSFSSTLNFGQSAFLGTAPTGFKPLCTAHLPAPAIPDPSAHFQADTLVGNATDDTDFTFGGNSDLAADMLWFKNRDVAGDVHCLFDRIRGVNNYLVPDQNIAEQTDANSLQAFLSNGGTVGTAHAVNGPSENMMVLGFKFDGTTGASNTDGDVTSTVSVNETAGMAYGTFTTSASAATAFTVGTGMTGAAEFLIVKNVSTGSFFVYHKDLGPTKYFNLDVNTTPTTATLFDDTAPAGGLFTLHTTHVGTSQNFWFLAFKSIPGFSKIGSYTGNGAVDGPMVPLDFRPAFLLARNFSRTAGNAMHDAARDPYNVMGNDLVTDTAAAENTELLNSDELDFLSNGFKLRDTAVTLNESAVTIGFLAIAETPFGGIGTSQARAR